MTKCILPVIAAQEVAGQDNLPGGTGRMECVINRETGNTKPYRCEPHRVGETQTGSALYK
jgi:hypothetical protein